MKFRTLFWGGGKEVEIQRFFNDYKRDEFEFYFHIEKDFEYDLIIIPFIECGENELNLIKDIKTYDKLCRVPIIAIIEKKTPEIIRELFSRNISDYVVAPVYGPELFERSKRIIELNNKINELKENIEEKNKYLGILAHDIRNSLQHIIGYVELSKYDIENNIFSNLKNYQNKIEYSSEFISKLLKEVLDISKIESGNLTFEYKNVNLKELMNQISEFYQKSAEKKKIKLFAEISIIDEAIFLCDDLKIEQIINNLVSNAIKFCKEDDIIIFKAFFEEENLVLSIEDNGPGIPVNEQGNIFDYFTKTSVLPTGNELSTGLGLAIVKKLSMLLVEKLFFAASRERGLFLM